MHIPKVAEIFFKDHSCPTLTLKGTATKALSSSLQASSKRGFYGRLVLANTMILNIFNLEGTG